MSVKRFPIEPAIEIDPRTEEEEERGRCRLRIYLRDGYNEWGEKEIEKGNSRGYVESRESRNNFVV